MDRPPVEMVRVEREEEVFDREAVLGRDASSVFPNESKAAAALDPDMLRQLIGATNFVSEKELEEIKATHGARVEDGSVARDKSLAEVLAENKAAKEDAFKEVWETMKRGKNTPLTEDEAYFIDAVESQKAAAERMARAQEAEELAEFRKAVTQRTASGSDAEASDAGPGPALMPLPQLLQQQAQPQRRTATAAPRPHIRPLIRPRSAVDSHAAAGSGGAPDAKRPRLGGDPAHGTGSSAAGVEAGVGSKGTKQEGEHSNSNNGLAGLLGDYGSGDDSDG